MSTTATTSAATITFKTKPFLKKDGTLNDVFLYDRQIDNIIMQLLHDGAEYQAIIDNDITISDSDNWCADDAALDSAEDLYTRYRALGGKHIDWMDDYKSKYPDADGNYDKVKIVRNSVKHRLEDGSPLEKFKMNADFASCLNAILQTGSLRMFGDHNDGLDGPLWDAKDAIKDECRALYSCYLDLGGEEIEVSIKGNDEEDDYYTEGEYAEDDDYSDIEHKIDGGTTPTPAAKVHIMVYPTLKVSKSAKKAIITEQHVANMAPLGEKAAEMKAEMKELRGHPNMLKKIRWATLDSTYIGCIRSLSNGTKVLVWAFHAFEIPIHGKYRNTQPLKHLGLFNIDDLTVDPSEAPPPLPCDPNHWPWLFK